MNNKRMPKSYETDKESYRRRIADLEADLAASRVENSKEYQRGRADEVAAQTTANKWHSVEEFLKLRAENERLRELYREERCLWWVTLPIGEESEYKADTEANLQAAATEEAWYQCHRCRGTGYTLGTSCTDCKGTGRKAAAGGEVRK